MKHNFFFFNLTAVGVLDHLWRFSFTEQHQQSEMSQKYKNYWP